jgi:uncharacterized damage-inducible protein DinB
MGGADMSDPDDSQDLPALRERLKAARTRLATMPISNRPAVGPTDPSTGESWHSGNVLGHMAEMLAYWHNQIGLAAEGSGRVGRDEAGAQSRRRGIDRGEPSSEADLKSGVDAGIEHCLTLLDELSPDDLERTVVYHSRDGDREVRLGELVQLLVVGHVEEHITQLEALG